MMRIANSFFATIPGQMSVNNPDLDQQTPEPVDFKPCANKEGREGGARPSVEEHKCEDDGDEGEDEGEEDEEDGEDEDEGEDEGEDDDGEDDDGEDDGEDEDGEEEEDGDEDEDEDGDGEEDVMPRIMQLENAMLLLVAKVARLEEMVEVTSF